MIHDLHRDRAGGGYARLTCRTCGVQIVRQPYITQDVVWTAMVNDFRKSHPDGRQQDTVYITVHDGPDQHGDYFFTMDWWDENFHSGPSWRGQCFRANPDEYAKRARANKLKVSEADERGKGTF